MDVRRFALGACHHWQFKTVSHKVGIACLTVHVLACNERIRDCEGQMDLVTPRWEHGVKVSLL